MLPVLVLFLLALVQTALVARDQLLVQDAARAAVREASVGADDGRVVDAARRTLGGVEVEVHRADRIGDPVSVRVQYVDHTNLPLVGPAVPRRRVARERHDARRTMRSERGNVSLMAVAGVGLALVLCLGVARVGSAVVPAVARRHRRRRGRARRSRRARARAEHVRCRRRRACRRGRQRCAARCCARAGATSPRSRSSSIGAVGRAHGHARAEVDLSRAPVLAP